MYHYPRASRFSSFSFHDNVTFNNSIFKKHNADHKQLIRFKSVIKSINWIVDEKRKRDWNVGKALQRIADVVKETAA